MAAEVGISHHSVHEIWRRNDLKPHLLRTFKISNDPKFEEKFWDVIGLYLNPPDQALVLYCDEKSQCQALEGTQLVYFSRISFSIVTASSSASSLADSAHRCPVSPARSQPALAPDLPNLPKRCGPWGQPR